MDAQSVVAVIALLACACSGPGVPPPRPAPTADAPQDAPRDEVAEAPPERVVLDDRAPIHCADVTRENTPDGLVRIHFDRLYSGCTPDLCGLVIPPQNILAFARYLQERLVQQPGCEQCQVANVARFVAVDVDLWVEGRWFFEEYHQEWLLYAFIPPYAAPERTGRMQFEDAYFFYNRGQDGFEGFFHAVCPGSPEDPDAPGPRIVSDECMTFRSEPFPEAHPVFVEDAE